MTNLWDEGNIADAVTKAKNIGAIFIVFIKGDNELSVHYENLFSDDIVLLKLKTKHFVAIKVQHNTTAHQQFSAIYPNNSIPSIFFIGKNGKPIEIITENMSVDEFRGRIDNIILNNGIILQQGPVSESMIKNEQDVVTPSENILPDAVASTSVDSNQVSSQPSGDLTPEEKIEYARRLIEQKKEEQRRQEEEEKKLLEIERRKIGQSIQQMKKLQYDEELKQLMEERNKEKKENKAARDRVLAQIAQDKAERASKFSNQIPSGVPQMSQSVAQPKRPTLQNNITRLQFRLPDGSSHTKEFQISDSLEIVHQYIQNEMHLPFTNYMLSTTFPRREFSNNESSQSLLDLQLVPNAVILILPQNQGVVSSSTNKFIGGIFGWLMTPLLNVYKFLVGFLFSGPPTSNRVEPSNAKRPASDVEDSTRNLPKKQASDSTVIKRQGNVHRLKDRPDSDDDNNTWNGNSTQQM
ncbi:hypothetical protein WA026_004970 [Henosepilachna vigintioctopunctata]|uniref:UBX domain-containing protein 4 n=1 Tax=Henosepilachna vigintioctopunctata TaxID=420089 RepID=A0AAW1UKJ5_9CUCU